MKKLALILALVLAYSITQAQSFTQVPGRWEYDNLGAVKTLRIPNDTLSTAHCGRGLALKNNKLYFRNSSCIWSEVSGGINPSDTANKWVNDLRRVGLNWQIKKGTTWTTIGTDSVLSTLATASQTATGNFSHNWGGFNLPITNIGAMDLTSTGTASSLIRNSGIRTLPTSSSIPMYVFHNIRNAASTFDSIQNTFILGSQAQGGFLLQTKDLAATQKFVFMSGGLHTGVDGKAARLVFGVDSAGKRSVINMFPGSFEYQVTDSVIMSGLTVVAGADTIMGLLPSRPASLDGLKYSRLVKVPVSALTATVNLGVNRQADRFTITNSTGGAAVSVVAVSDTSTASGAATRDMYDAYKHEVYWLNADPSSPDSILVKTSSANADTFRVKPFEIVQGTGIVVTKNADTNANSYTISSNNAGSVTSVNAVDGDGFDVTVNNPTSNAQVSVKTTLTVGKIPYITGSKGIGDGPDWNSGLDMLSANYISSKAGSLNLRGVSGSGISFSEGANTRASMAPNGIFYFGSYRPLIGTPDINVGTGGMQLAGNVLLNNSSKVRSTFGINTTSAYIGTDTAFKFEVKTNDTARMTFTPDGSIRIMGLDTDTTAPSTMGTTKMVIVDDTGKLSFANIPGGGGGLSDGDYGDVVVSGSATVIKVDNHVPHTIASGSVSSAAQMDVVLTSAALGTTYDRVEIQFFCLPATDNVKLRMRFSTNGGSSYDAGGGNYEWVSNWATSGGAGNNVAGSATELELVDAAGNSSAGGCNGKVTLYNYTDGAKKTMYTGESTSMATGGTAIILSRMAGQRTTSQDTDAVRFYFSSGNITTGTYRVIGYKN